LYAVRKPAEERPLGKPVYRFKGNIKTDLK
jgi:hypothetical protein